MNVQPKFAGATIIQGEDFSDHRPAINRAFENVTFTRIGDHVAVFTPDLPLEGRYRDFLTAHGIDYEKGRSTSFDEYERTEANEGNPFLRS